MGSTRVVSALSSSKSDWSRPYQITDRARNGLMSEGEGSNFEAHEYEKLAYGI